MVLRTDKAFSPYGSNRHVFIEAALEAYSPDASVAKGEPVARTYARGKEAYPNPWLVVEVTSPSSLGRDFGEKLQAYKSIPSLQHIFYIGQDAPSVTLFSRIDAHRWQGTGYNTDAPLIELDTFSIFVLGIYENL